MKRIKVDVTKKNIKDGILMNSYSCPVALALLDKELWFTVSVDGETVDFNAFHKRYNLSTRAKRFISKFDGGKKVEPFSFYLNMEEAIPVLKNIEE